MMLSSRRVTTGSSERTISGPGYIIARLRLGSRLPCPTMHVPVWMSLVLPRGDSSIFKIQAALWRTPVGMGVQ
jgi:hypothetical protein